eukprot:7016269-Alexandrium_andersonii.AAC.1
MLAADDAPWVALLDCVHFLFMLFVPRFLQERAVPDADIAGFACILLGCHPPLREIPKPSLFPDTPPPLRFEGHELF